ncbi:hypothetical protein [Streptomyces sp. cmx-18-6]|uniref:hypothetical protein n=1 Tax=Streptomyces sp. cmx-18-6 TaxID=2790930 RepID=UPI003980571F
MTSTVARARRLVEQAEAVLGGQGLSARFEVEEGRDCCLIDVEFADDKGFLTQVSDAVVGRVGVLDPYNEDLTEEQWLRHVLARAAPGAEPGGGGTGGRCR